VLDVVYRHRLQETPNAEKARFLLALPLSSSKWKEAN